MNELMAETMARTGGRFMPVDWERRIVLAQSQPNLCRIVGVVHGEMTGDKKLLAFVCGCHHGTHAQYSEGASARQLGRLPLMYPLLWDLIRWARDNGAQWFDMRKWLRWPPPPPNPQDPTATAWRNFAIVTAIDVGYNDYFLNEKVTPARGIWIELDKLAQ